jgi:hypothetical protein
MMSRRVTGLVTGGYAEIETDAYIPFGVIDEDHALGLAALGIFPSVLEDLIFRFSPTAPTLEISNLEWQVGEHEPCKDCDET